MVPKNLPKFVKIGLKLCYSVNFELLQILILEKQGEEGDGTYPYDRFPSFALKQYEQEAETL